MKIEVQVIGTVPTLVIDGHAVVRVKRGKKGERREIVLEPYAEGSGYPTSITPAEMSKHLLRYVNGRDSFPRHDCTKELRDRLVSIASGTDDADWILFEDAARRLGLTVATLHSMKNRGKLIGLEIRGGRGKGNGLRVSKSSLESFISQRNFASGFGGAQSSPFTRESGFSQRAF